MRSVVARLLKGAPRTENPSPGLKAFMLVTVCLVTVLAMVDRNILNILLTPIKKELGVSDTAMGLLTGTAFALFYCTAAIPMARLVDAGNRRNILALSLAFWSAATALCGLANSYLHLLIARIGVAAGESSANPAIMSMISDLFPANRRATAVASTTIGLGLGVLLGAAFGGYLADEIGWRGAFVAVGLPGFLLAMVMWLFIPEPVRGAYDGGAKMDADSASTWSTIRYLFRIPSFNFICLGKTSAQIATQAQLIWFPTYLIRVHDLSLTQTGLYYGLAIGIGTTVSSVIGAPLADFLARKGAVWYLWVCILSMVLAAPFALSISFAPSAMWAIALLFCWNVTATLNGNSAIAASLAIVRPRMRGMMTALFYFIYNLIGAGLGGLLIGMLNDALAPRFGDEAIRYSLMAMPAASVLAGVFYFLGSRTVNRDVEAARRSAEEEALA